MEAFGIPWREPPPDSTNTATRQELGKFVRKPELSLKTWCLAVVVASWIAQPVRGQISPDSHPRKWELSFLAGAGSLSGSTAGFTASESGASPVSLDYNSGYSFGFGVVENLAERFGAEMRYGIGSLPLDVGNSTAESATTVREHHVHGIIYSVLCYPRGWKRGRLVPYALSGIGASLFQPSDDPEAMAGGVSLKNRWKLAGEVGGGVRLYLDRLWGLRFEVRDRITGTPDYGLAAAPSPAEGAGVAAASGRLHHWQFHVGVTYNLAP